MKIDFPPTVEEQSGWSIPGVVDQFEIPHDELHWPPSDILVSYDSTTECITYSKLSSGEPLMVYNVAKGERVH